MGPRRIQSRRSSDGSSKRKEQLEGTVLVLFSLLITNGFWFWYIATKTFIPPPLFGLEHSRESALTSLLTQQQQQSVDKKILFAFTIRDSRHLVPVEPPPGIHIYDYVDVYQAEQVDTLRPSQLYLDGRYVAETPCVDYNLECYRDKLLQTFPHALNASRADYFYYMESDNVLCVPLQQIQDLALRHGKYFLGTGVGASGWLMRRDFVEDFLEEYQRMKEMNRHANHDTYKEQRDMPDVVASNMLLRRNQWAVTNRYFVAHAILHARGAAALTRKHKHLPRCLEPHRGKWELPNGADEFGWDYFDYNKCPNAEVYPCHDNDEVVPAKLQLSQLEDTSSSTRPPIRLKNGKTLPPVQVISNKDHPGTPMERYNWALEQARAKERGES